MEPFDAILGYLSQGKKGALATIISRVGSVPREIGAKIFVGDDGRVYGTIGGGCIEAEIWYHARSVTKQGKAKRLCYALKGKTVEDEGMICGGTVELFIEPAMERHHDIYEKIIECIDGGNRAVVITNIEGTPFLKTLITEDGNVMGDRKDADVIEGGFDELFHDKTLLIKDGMMIETIVPQPHLYIYGAGHISQYISQIAKVVDFHVTVIDDRADFANRDRFPEADEVVVEEFDNVLQKILPLRNGYAVIVTRGHKHDAVVLEKLLGIPLRYVGMIGSRRKAKILFDDLRKKGAAEDLLQAVHAPIGIDIGAETPREIAVSIVAELIKLRNGKT